ncbi:unnamed protein product [Clonostachys solani]|uniref:Uncharacterized protein n=1 Tax=Clonostachys solani TaxID=160281 RepID=A0A9N9ZCN1_9HYPO|nr:unnamed protein product [Clonostachys solani]
MVINANLEDKTLTTQQLQTLNEHGAVWLVLQQVTEALDLGPSIPSDLLDTFDISLQDLRTAWDRGPWDDTKTQLGVLSGGAIALLWLAQGNTLQSLDLLQGKLPPRAIGGTGLEVILEIGLDKHKSQQRRGRFGSFFELLN